MIRHQKHLLLIISSILFGAMALSACMPTTPEISSEQLETEQPAIEETDVASDFSIDTLEEISTDKEDSLSSESNSINFSGLSDAEINSLVFMREEEKLARDVYLSLYDLWGLHIFQILPIANKPTLMLSRVYWRNTISLIQQILHPQVYSSTRIYRAL